MTYEELVAKAREVFGKADASGIQEHVAYQFNITGEGEGAFYLEIDHGTVKIEPYEYYDRDVLFTMTAKNLIKIGLGELDPVWAFTTGRLKLEGSIEKALLLKDLAASVKEKLAKEAAGEAESACAEVSAVTEQNGSAAEQPTENAGAGMSAATEQNGSAAAEQPSDIAGMESDAVTEQAAEQLSDIAATEACTATEQGGDTAEPMTDETTGDEKASEQAAENEDDGESDETASQPASAAEIRFPGQLPGRGNRNKKNRKKKRR